MLAFKNLRNRRRIILLLFDILCFVLVDAFYYLLSRRAANSMPVDDFERFLQNSTVQLVCILLMRAAFRVYQNVWRYPDVGAYFSLVAADAAGGVLGLVFLRFLSLYYGLWQAAVVGALTVLLALVSRFVYSLLYRRASAPKDGRVRVPAAIVGAGRLGSFLAEDLRNNPNSAYAPMFFVDTDEAKVGNFVTGLKVYDPEVAATLIKKLEVQEIIVAITERDSDNLSELYYYYSGLGCRVHMYDTLVGGEAGLRHGVIREFSIEDLLFRKPLDFVENAVCSLYTGKTVLVTGGGGSIGSELCRQLAKCRPARLVIFDIYENNAYDIQQELVRLYGSALELYVEIGSVRDEERLDELFSAYRPDIVFHAAAHKHVPLMERNGKEAVKNNVLGTYNTANAAERYGTARFILISTDKAVNPTSIMGASKRVCEMIVQCRADSATNFAAVRFGNVLGSNGSVIPLFKRQIAEGGPVTVTDKRIIRYFMTIPEAVQLVMQAGAMANQGELFVLDMGKPVKIYDLAVNMIRLSGLEPGTDIRIEEIGLRPGEKLYEELLMKNEHMEKTDNDLIFIEHDTPYSREEVGEKIAVLTAAVRQGGLREAMARVVPTYRDADAVNDEAEAAEEMRLAHV